ncbi:MAG: amidohydrolase family protein [Gemmatimonadaceae bacterium]
MRHAMLASVLTAALALPLAAQRAESLSAGVRQFVSVDAPVVALTHVRVIDGTGAAAKGDQTVLIANGVISAVGPSASTPAPDGAKVIDLTGASVIPGLVMVHEHLFYPAGGLALYTEQAFSFPRLYLAGGVTTMRTGGSMEPYTDLNLKRMIETGAQPGPHIDVTGPYLEHSDLFYQVHPLNGAEDARRTVAYWADLGATSFKAYMHITRAELGAAIAEAHKRGLKVTGHLCSVTFHEAAALGIDNLEHGLMPASDFVEGKVPDECPPAGVTASLVALDTAGEPMRALIRDLVAHKVAITSTLTIFETFTPGRQTVKQPVLDAMLSDARQSYLTNRARVLEAPSSPYPALLKKTMVFEREFVRAGGLLLVGTDPTGFGGVIAGYSNQRALELLVEAGFSPIEAIAIATSNGARYLGRDKIGTIAVGKNADLVVVRGDPSVRITDIERMETVFKDGVGYDSAKLFAAVKGIVGLK